jgi:hypothetical protein
MWMRGRDMTQIEGRRMQKEFRKLGMGEYWVRRVIRTREMGQDEEYR